MNNITLSVVGMGYVGMPIAVEFAKKLKVYGFDINEEKINSYKNGIDPTDEVGGDVIKNSNIIFTNDEKCLSESDFIIVAVPTPINQDKSPNLEPVISASKLIGQNIKKDSYIIFESTVYPGVTEDVCIPILEEYSNLVCGKDFHVGYSPERINPGDKVHKLTNIKKVVAGQTDYETEKIAKLYEMVVEAGVHKVSNIKTAEATKVIENSQRDINIAFMNEVAMIFNMMNIDTLEVIEAMNTKWNALGFTPGLVGGHCIGVDPYYFIYEAEKLGYHSELISTGRRINDEIPKFITENIIRQMIFSDQKIKNSKVLLMGLAFKENTPDCRNSKIAEVYRQLSEYGVDVYTVDPLVNPEDALREYGIKLYNFEDINDIDGIILGVKHEIFKNITLKEFLNKFNTNNKPFITDVKGFFKNEDINENINYWRL
ncbi:nucleotide sugar dehydrogenase [Macrococcoides canis]|uniref:nucleotide sugar dehydrogenase n=1 Tax=Macrococcoides canis TaxID=1855823 RepID=UPI0010FC0E1C|nr:nucleotide sugar dehydrogenase [Macrococcus canis]QCT74504.1 nucleotide sugar dehydrogenase [Macrococcus canis]